jgi:hypothetical protein
MDTITQMNLKRAMLRFNLIQGYIQNAERDRKITAEWQAIDDESWLTYIPAYGEEPLSVSSTSVPDALQK